MRNEVLVVDSYNVSWNAMALCRNYFLFKYWNVYFWDHINWDVGVPSNFDCLNVASFSRINFLGFFNLSRISLFHRDINYSFNFNWLNFVVIDWHKMSVVNLDHRIWKRYNSFVGFEISSMLVWNNM